jgi:hypothetical protein
MIAALIVVGIRVVLDVQMISLGLVKLELGNALQLEQHAGIRSGAVLVMTDLELTYSAIHHWILHIPMLLNPRPESAAVFLVFVDFLTAGVWFWVVDRRWGRMASCTVVALYLSTPVAPILSKHVIATAFVPLAAACLFEGFLRVRDENAASGVKWCVWSMASLILFNVNHVVLIPAALWVIWGRFRGEKIPWVGLGVLALGLLPLLYPSNGGTLTRAFSDLLSRPGEMLANPGWFARRMIFVEPYMTEMAPALYGWPVVLLLGLGVWVKERTWGPGGLLPILLSCPLFLLVSDVEATVVWQAGLFVLMAWTASRAYPLALISLLYGVVAQAVIAHTFLTFGPPPQTNFFSLSTVAQKDEILLVLRDEFQMKRGELETLQVIHEIGENGLPAPAPGLRYLADLGPAFPPGGERCLGVSQEPFQVHGSARVLRRHVEGGLHYTAWVGGPPCKTNLVHKLPKALYLDLNSWTFTRTPPWRVGTDLPH